MTTFWRRNLIFVDGLLATLAGLFLACLLYRETFGELAVDNAQTIAILSALVNLFGTLLGFVIAMIALLFSAIEQPSFKILRASESYRIQWAIFKGALYSCFTATVLSVIGLFAAWVSMLGVGLKCAIVAASIWVVIRLIRVVWVLKLMIEGEVRLGRELRKHLKDN